VNDGRRSKPAIWHTDWLVLRGMARVLGQLAQGRLRRGDRLVDLGCGEMPYRAMLEQLGVHYMGADIGGSAEVKIGPNGRTSLDAGAADAVLSVQVLEHVEDLDAYCAEIRRLLKDDGQLILSTHGAWLYHPHPEDYRRWTRVGLTTDLALRDLVVEEIFPVVGPLATTTLIRLTGFNFVLRKIPIVGPPLGALSAIVMNIRALVEDRLTPFQMRLDNACVYMICARKAAS
jgi:SAM-dependent methyltransferase